MQLAMIPGLQEFAEPFLMAGDASSTIGGILSLDNALNNKDYSGAAFGAASIGEGFLMKKGIEQMKMGGFETKVLTGGFNLDIDMLNKNIEKNSQ